MSIKFFLTASKLTSIPGKYVACVDTNMTVGLDFLAELIAQSGLSASSAEIKGILARACEIIEQQVTAGNLVQLGGICNIRPTIRGTFDSISSGFDPTENSVEVAVAAGSRLRKAVQKNASVEKVGKPAPLPDMSEYYDVTTGTTNSEISAGSIGQFNGNDLSYDAEDNEQGLFVVDGVSPAPMKINTIQKATDSQIVFLTQCIDPTAVSVYFLLRRRNKTEGPLVEAQSCDLTVSA